MRVVADASGGEEPEPPAISTEGGGAMEGFDWFWMTLMMGFWLIAIGTVVYVAVRLATRRPSGGHP
jgi:hypothetical protein